MLEENMNSTIKMALVAGLALGGLGFAAETASALPASGLDNAVAHQSDVQQGIQKTRYICGYWGCRWVPGPYWGYGYYHPYWHRWGWRRW
jgi:hypothetical protein